MPERRARPAIRAGSPPCERLVYQIHIPARSKAVSPGGGSVCGSTALVLALRGRGGRRKQRERRNERDRGPGEPHNLPQHWRAPDDAVGRTGPVQARVHPA